MSTDDAQSSSILDEKASIFVPSRYGEGGPVPTEVRDNEIRIVSGVLSRLFGGATSEEIAAKAKRIVGTFRHELDRSERFVDEEVYRVWAAASAAQVGNTVVRDAVLAEASRLRDALAQECVLVEWGREILFTASATHPSKPVQFGRLKKVVQEDFALMAWHRVAKPGDISGVLCLAGWRYPKSPADVTPAATDARTRSAWLEGEQPRSAWIWQRPDPPRDEDLKELGTDDLLVMATPDAKLRIWLRTKDRWAGPRDIPLATDERPTTRLAIEFVLALCDGDSRLTLPQLLDAEGATGRFYRDIQSQIQAVKKSLPRGKDVHAQRFAQRLIGRLLFLRFVEEKGWLPGGGLAAIWENRTGNYYRDGLLELFRALNTPHPNEGTGSNHVPYLNGGLFSVREEDETIELPDKLFDPGRGRDSVLGVLYEYQFTLDEAAAREQVVSVDPAMLGRVLESLAPDETRKSKGVHYTPAPIARALAAGGILPQLARRAKARGLDGVDEPTLERLRSGDRHAVTDRAAEILQEEIRDLKIVDPAVGSGALLVACLDVLLELEAGCERVLGGDLRKGSRHWARRARHFVKECLYGVDISPEAVEVAQLRFWLFLAVGENVATALPDLGYNLRVGNSLAFDAAEERLAKEIAKQDGRARSLEFSKVERALNSVLDRRRAFADAADAAPSVRATAFAALEEAERGLRVALGGKVGRTAEAPPFAWTVHFPEVFQGKNRGFDLVIANPPYVRTSSLAPADSAELKERYRSMQNKNIDLYYAFVERCLRPPIARKGKKDEEERYGLAGRAGGIAFILPSFAQTTSAEVLRSVLAEGGHVERWVDFLDLQVFPTATNYVALLFATAERRHRKTFMAQIVTPQAFARMKADQPWLRDLRPNQVQYRAEGWNVRPAPKVKVRESRSLGEIATVQVGIQTSLDEFYLFEAGGPPGDPKLILAKNAVEKEPVVLERAALFPCAKGSRELRGDSVREGWYVLWPYGSDGSLMTAEQLESLFPRAWEYLLVNRRRLEEREAGKFKVPMWWRFRRPQGVKCAAQPKVLVPSMMEEPTAFHDRDGRWICTASGKGGGGGWVIQPAKGTTLDLDRLAAHLRSEEYWDWIAANAEPKKGGWWGVDRKTLERCPVPLSVVNKE